MRHLGNKQFAPLVTYKGALMWIMGIITYLSRTKNILTGFFTQVIVESAGQALVPVYATAYTGRSMLYPPRSCPSQGPVRSGLRNIFCATILARDIKLNNLVRGVEH